MKIRPEQMAAFENERLDQLVADAAIMVTKRYPEVGLRLSPQALDAMVRERIAEAGRIGIHSERGAMRYIEYTIEFRKGLWTDPAWEWAREILLNPKLTEEQKLARIDHLAYGAKAPDESN